MQIICNKKEGNRRSSVTGEVNNAMKRASKIFDTNEMNNLKCVQLALRPRASRRLPRKSQIMLPIKDLKNVNTSQKLNCVLMLCLSLMIITGSFYETKVLFMSNYELSFQMNLLRLVLLVLACAQLLLAVIYYYNLLKIRISYKIISKHSMFYQDDVTFYQLLFELVICVIVIPPYLTVTVSLSQISTNQTLSLDDLLLLFIFLRLYYIYKLYYELSYFTSTKAKFYCNIEAVANVFKFAMKCLLKDRPWYSISIMFLLFTLFGGILLNIYEESVPNSPFAYIWNAFWIIAYSMPTIGYGEITPSTHLGRGVVIICVLAGLFMYSYIVLTVRLSTEFSDNEFKLYSEIKYKFKGARALKKDAAVLLQIWWRLYMKRRIRASHFNDNIKLMKKVRAFSLKRRMVAQEKNPTINEEITSVVKSSSESFKKIIHYLKPIEKYEIYCTKFANLNYLMTQRTKMLERLVRSTCNISGKLKNKNNSVNNVLRKVSHNESRTALKKLQVKAVKKMLIIKGKKNSISISPSIRSSYSSDDDFYSIKNS